MIMQNNFMKLMLLIMQAEYNNNIKNINDLLMEIYDAEAVNYICDFSNFASQKNCVYIPIYIENSLHAFYQIKNPANKLSIFDSELLSVLLSQMYINILINLPSLVSNEYDQSTNTFNRNSFERFKQCYNSLKYESICCIYVDINCLNEINNAYGHHYGDNVILKVANTLKQDFNGDRVYRIGGDEFVVIILNKKEEDIIIQANNTKELLKNDNINISIGINYENNVFDIEKFIDEADRRMYEDKEDFYQKNQKNVRKRYYK